MSDALSLTVPDEYHDWPHDARAFVLAEANRTSDLRREINSLVGLEEDDFENNNAGQFTKEQLATIVLALGGPQGVSD